MRRGSTLGRVETVPGQHAPTSKRSKGMNRRHYRYDHYGRRRRAPGRYGYGPGRRGGLFPVRGALIVLLALAALVVLASLT